MPTPHALVTARSASSTTGKLTGAVSRKRRTRAGTSATLTASDGRRARPAAPRRGARGTTAPRGTARTRWRRNGPARPGRPAAAGSCGPPRVGEREVRPGVARRGQQLTRAQEFSAGEGSPARYAPSHDAMPTAKGPAGQSSQPALHVPNVLSPEPREQRNSRIEAARRTRYLRGVNRRAQTLLQHRDSSMRALGRVWLGRVEALGGCGLFALGARRGTGRGGADVRPAGAGSRPSRRAHVLRTRSRALCGLQSAAVQTVRCCSRPALAHWIGRRLRPATVPMRRQQAVPRHSLAGVIVWVLHIYWQLLRFAQRTSAAGRQVPRGGRVDTENDCLFLQRKIDLVCQLY